MCYRNQWPIVTHSGIDGIIHFQDDQSGIDKARSVPRKIVVSVKGGENIAVAMIRDFAHVIDRENMSPAFAGFSFI